MTEIHQRFKAELAVTAERIVTATLRGQHGLTMGAGIAPTDGLVDILKRIECRMTAVEEGTCKLRQENAELKQFQAEGCFKFALRVTGADFQTFAVIMALGNRKAAAEHLGIPLRSLYRRVEQWQTRGREYQLMNHYIAWRKRSSRHLKVRLDESLQYGEASTVGENPQTLGSVLEALKAAEHTNYPDLLGQILQALQCQNAKNWQSVSAELIQILKEEVRQ